MIEPIDRHELIDSSEPADAIEPTDSAEPTEPIDRTDPLEAIDSTEFSDHSDHLLVSRSAGIDKMVKPTFRGDADEHHRARAADADVCR
jgi:hypothetical protein